MGCAVTTVLSKKSKRHLAIRFYQEEQPSEGAKNSPMVGAEQGSTGGSC